MKGKSCYIISALFFALTFGMPVHAQNFTEDMKRMHENRRNQPISFTIKYLYFPYDSIYKVADSIKGNCFLNGTSYYYKINTKGRILEYLKNQKYYIVIDNKQKIIAINKSSAARQELWEPGKIDSLIKTKTAKISYKNKSSDEGEYDISLTKGTWNKIKIQFNKNTYVLEALWLSSSSKGTISGQPYKKPRIGILYTNYEAAKSTMNLFNEEKYVVETKNGMDAVKRI